MRRSRRSGERHCRQTFTGAVFALTAAVACSGITPPLSAPDASGTVISWTVPLPAAHGPATFGLSMEEESLGCRLEINAHESDMVLRLPDGTVQKSSGIQDLHAGLHVRVWTEDRVDSCERDAVATAVEIDVSS